MATSQPGQEISLPAAADLSAKQYHFVKVDSNSKAAAVTATNDVIVGVLTNAPTTDQAASITISGLEKIELAATLAAGAVVAPNTDGEAQAAVALNRPAGQLKEGGADGELGTIILNPSLVTIA